MSLAHQIVAQQIIDKLESVDPTNWTAPWFPINGRPQNIRGNHYRGINTLLLGGGASFQYATFKQWKEKDCKIIKGEKGNIAVFFKMQEYEDKDNPGEMKNIPLLRYYKVFGLHQVEGEYADKLREKNEADKQLIEHGAHDAAEQAIKDYLARENIKVDNSDRACYIPALDRIEMPQKGQFRSLDMFYSVYFHEMAHSTGHKTRLDRLQEDSYAFEELTAEFCAAMACAHYGVTNVPRNDHAQYIAGWIKRLKDKPQAAVNSAAKAQKALEFIIGEQAEEKKAA